MKVLLAISAILLSGTALALNNLTVTQENIHNISGKTFRWSLSYTTIRNVTVSNQSGQAIGIIINIDAGKQNTRLLCGNITSEMSSSFPGLCLLKDGESAIWGATSISNNDSGYFTIKT